MRRSCRANFLNESRDVARKAIADFVFYGQFKDAREL